MHESENTPPNETGQEERHSQAGFRMDPNVILGKALSVIRTPGAYFREMPVSGGFLEPLVFAIAMSLVAGFVSAILSFVGTPVGFLAYGFAAIIIIPIGMTIGLFIGGGILFGVWKLMGSTKDYEASVRCVASLSAIYPITAVLYLVPYLGTIIGLAWAGYLLIEASVAVHGRDRRQAQIVFGIITALLILMNVGAEHTARNLADQAEELGKILEQYK